MGSRGLTGWSSNSAQWRRMAGRNTETRDVFNKTICICRDSEPMRTATIYRPNQFIRAIFQFKDWDYEEKAEPAPAFPDTDAPVTHIEGAWILGVYPITLYLDARKPLPALLPTEPLLRASAAMVLDMLLAGRPFSEAAEILKDQPYILGNTPYVIDALVALRNITSPNPTLAAHRDRVLGWSEDDEFA